MASPAAALRACSPYSRHDSAVCSSASRMAGSPSLAATVARKVSPSVVAVRGVALVMTSLARKRRGNPWRQGYRHNVSYVKINIDIYHTACLPWLHRRTAAEELGHDTYPRPSRRRRIQSLL